MRKILLSLVLFLTSCGGTDLYKEKGFGFDREDNLYTSDFRTCGTMVAYAMTSADYPDLGYVTVADGLQIYAQLPNKLKKSWFSMHGLYPLYPFPIVYIPWFWVGKEYAESSNILLMVSFRVERDGDFWFNDEKVYIEKDGKKYYPKNFGGGYVEKSVRGRVFAYRNIENFRDKNTKTFNITKMQEFEGLECKNNSMLCVCSSRNFIYGFEFDLKYVDLEGATLVIDGLKKNKSNMLPIDVKFKYSEGWILRGMIGP